MFFLVLFTYLFLLPLVIIAFLWKILNKLEEISKYKISEPKNTRTHAQIKKSNYDNAFGGRAAYKIYQNTDGLYEPITPSKGIKLKKEE